MSGMNFRLLPFPLTGFTIKIDFTFTPPVIPRNISYTHSACKCNAKKKIPPKRDQLCDVSFFSYDVNYLVNVLLTFLM